MLMFWLIWKNNGNECFLVEGMSFLMLCGIILSCGKIYLEDLLKCKWR